MTKERLIKKYANRRLYDASQSRHVTLEDIRRFVVQGEKITVVEDKTGEDITRLILLQVIAEQEQFGQPILSTTLLESIIRFYGNGMQDFMARYLEKSVETFSRQQESVQAQMSKLMANAPMNAMTEIARQNMELWAKMNESMASAFGGARTSRARDARTDGPQGGADAGTGGDTDGGANGGATGGTNGAPQAGSVDADSGAGAGTEHGTAHGAPPAAVTTREARRPKAPTGTDS